MRAINRFPARDDLKEKDSKCEDISLLINNPMHEVLRRQVPKYLINQIINTIRSDHVL